MARIIDFTSHLLQGFNLFGFSFEDDNEKVDALAPEYQDMTIDWEAPQALLGGTRAMRSAGERFLPKHKGEDFDDYQARLLRTNLFPGFERTVAKNSGKLFPARLVATEEIVDPRLEAWANNVDLQGNNLNTFGIEVFKDALAFGKTHVLTDFVLDPNAAERTREDDSLDPRRPYWIHIKHDQVFAWQIEFHQGVGVLTEVRIWETTRRRTGTYGSTNVRRIRVLRPGTFEVFEEDEAGSRNWVPVDAGVLLDSEGNQLTRIPLRTFYTNRTGILTARPPLEGLIYSNIEHWQSKSDQNWSLSFQRIPYLVGIGLATSEGEQIPIKHGPNILQAVPVDGDIKVVEGSGNSLSAGFTHLDRTEREMRIAGLELLLGKRPAGMTAFERGLDQTEANSPLKVMALQFENFFNTLLSDMAIFDKTIDVEKFGRIDFNTDLTVEVNDASALQTLMEAFKEGAISQQTFLDELQRRSILSDDVDIIKELEVTEVSSLQDVPEEGQNLNDNENTGLDVEALLQQSEADNPLRSGSSQEVINANIKKLMEEGFSREQAVAIAFAKAGRAT